MNCTSVDKVPTRRLSDYVLQSMPGTPVASAMQLNIGLALGVSYRQVLGAASKLLKDRKAYWRGATLVAITP